MGTLGSDIKYPSDANRFSLAPHFKANELECPCCKKIVIIPRLLNALETTRERIGVPILITSAMRCSRYQRHLYEQINTNRRLKGYEPLKVPRVGFHRTGEAIDTTSVIVPGEPGSDEEREFLEQLREDGWVGIGVQKEKRDGDRILQYGFTHLDVRMSAPALWRYGFGRPNG